MANAQNIYKNISPIFRNKRFADFMNIVNPKITDSILDVGGHPNTWIQQIPCGKRIEVLNLYEINFEKEMCENRKITNVVGDACDMLYGDGTFEILFSNSVIEHVGTWERQKKFAKEARRVGKKIWIQTPAKEFFIEPHYLALFVHWFPRKIRKHLLRYFTIWGWLAKPDKDRIRDSIEEIRLLTYSEVKALFPDCEIIREKVLFFFTKSYTAYRL